MGHEVRVVADLKLARSQVCNSSAEVFDTAEAWRAEAVEAASTE